MRTYNQIATTLIVVAFTALASAQSSVQVGFNASGLNSVLYSGQQYLAYWHAPLGSVNLLTPQGQTIAGSTQFTQQVDLAGSKITQSYNWGTVATTYTAAGNRLQIAITTTNTSSSTITGLFFDAMGLQLPSKPAEYDGVTPILGTNLGNPTALRLTYGTGAVVLTNDDVVQPLTVGFPWALDRPASTQFPTKINTGQDPQYPTIFPFVNRPIAPGGSDTFRVSYRFGTAATPTKTLAADVYQAFATAFPFIVNWSDRRPIGSLIIATSAAGWPTNPRGWLLDPSINVTTPQGVAAFGARLMTWADNAVAILKGMNAQGMITWDIEGEQFPQSTSYIGDPRLFSLLAPEMSGFADAYFKKFRDAGLKVGVCIRPQRLVYAADLSSASQQEVADPAQLMIDKMTWANQRWGATIFYVDSNGDPNLPYDVTFFRRVQQALPGVLVVPEHQNTGYYAVSAPYDELRQGVASTPSAVRDVYPGAFTVINTADGPIDARYAELKAAVAGGDILLFRGWFDDGNNAKIKALYSGQSVPPPAVGLSAPASGSTVAGTVAVAAQASGANGVAGVRLLVDNTQYGAEITSSPYSWQWNTTSLPNGAHVLTVIARDPDNQTGTASETVQVNNVVAPPVISIVSPAPGSTVSGSVSLQANASSSIGIASVLFSIDGTSVTSPWDSTKVANGVHSMLAVAKDNAGTTSSAMVTFNVYNAVAPPVISIVSPASGSTVSGSVALLANATSVLGIVSIVYLIDGSGVPSPWDSTGVSNGTHVVTAIAKDTAGTTASATATFTVQNGGGFPVTIVSPTAGSTVKGQVFLKADATSQAAVFRMQFTIDGSVSVSPPFWDSTTAADGTHTLSVTATDVEGRTSTASVSFTVQNRAAVPPPTVTITSPVPGSTVSGLVTLQANAASSIGIASVQFSVDGSAVSSPWDSNKVSNGSHTISAVAKDNAGITATATITVQVSNTGAPPVVTITSPAQGSTVSGTVVLLATATSSAGIASIQFAVDGAAVSSPWDSTRVADGTHTLTATAADKAGLSATATISLTVKNSASVIDTTPPSVSITGPANNSTTSGLIYITADASDNVAVAGVSFYLNNVLIGNSTTAPFQAPLDLHLVNGGLNYVTAVARDAAGNTASNSASFTNAERGAPSCGSIGLGTFVGCYYSSLNLTQLAVTRLDSALNFDWAWTAPDPALPANAYSIAWLGQFAFNGANYTFELKSVGGARIYIDGQAALDIWSNQTYADSFFTKALTPGSHVIRVEFHRGTDAGEAKLFWQQN